MDGGSPKYCSTPTEYDFPTEPDHTYEEEESYLWCPAQVVPVAIDYCLFFQMLGLTVTHHTWTGTLPVWWLLAPPNNLAHLNMDLQGITWKKCQEDVYEHIVSRHALLKSYIQHTNHRQETSWFGHINGDKLYGGHDGKGVQILNHLQFLDFATWAYNTYPCDIKIQVVMTEPPEAQNASRLDVKELHFCGITDKDRERYCASLNLITSKSSATVIDIEQVAARMPPRTDVFVTPPDWTIICDTQTRQWPHVIP
ncbi:hypothetical protein PCASD_01335 [Puccinia coronata f. sp. avenae]|uniref:Uncharacterized protein n=1 Tax=Puccinia coronata f. sp. avenae TaxID=200324 RepID=A0A2N5VJ26_9BASI|nr:hypothetical protein PCASD_01335 [Puccinia coronata f. sp. avenae]